MEKPLQVFCCYARKDQRYLHKLKNHLMTLQRENLIETKADINISPGREWEREIDRHLEEADIILLLISSDFIASNYCFDKEMQQAIARHQQGTARVVPVIIRPTDWENTPFGKLQALPKNAQPVTNWPNRESAWIDVVRGVRDIANELLRNPSISQSRMYDQQLPEPEYVAQQEAKTRSTRQKQRALDNVEKLAPGVDLSLYYDRFGKPIFINRRSYSINPNDELRKFIEYVFVDTYFYLDVIADHEGKVLYFALTTRDKSFNPTFKNQVFQITLGKSRYSDIPGGVGSAQGCFGANWFAYYETRYFGRPGAYEYFGFGFNSAGYSTERGVKAYRGLLNTTHNCHGTLSSQEIELVKEFSADEVFNTYAVSAPGVQITDYAHIILGVNYDQVRILNS